MKLTRREIFVVTISIIIISIILYVVYFYRPIISETNNLMAQLTTIERDVGNGQDLDTKLRRLNNELTTLHSELDFLHGDFIEGIEQAEVILFLEKLIKPFGLQKSIAFTGTEDYGLYKVAKVVLSIETNYSNLTMILKEIEQSPWRNRIEKMNAIIKNSDYSNSQQYNMEVEITIGFYCF